MAAPLLHHSDGVFYFMQYTTKTKVVKDVCLINVYRNTEFWHVYEFGLEQYQITEDRTFLDHISYKVWGTKQNLDEIAMAIFFYKNYQP